MKRSYTKLLRRLNSACHKHSYHCEVLGQVGNHDFVRVVHEPKGWQRSLVIVSTVHGDEVGCTEAVLRSLEEGMVSGSARVVLYPVVNIEGYIRNRRKDADGFDLNRTKSKCLRPPQTLLLTSLLTEPVDFFVALHEAANTSSFYQYAYHKKFDGYYRALQTAAGQHMKLNEKNRINGYDAERGIVYSREDGSIENWFSKKNIPSVCTETGMSAPWEVRVATNMAVVKEVIRKLK